MRYITTLAALSAATFLTAGTAFAQSPVFSNQNAAEDRIDDLEEDIVDDQDRDIDIAARGNAGRTPGFNGNFALRGQATDGNTDTVDVGIGTRLDYFDGLNGHRVTLSYDYSQEDDNKTSDSLLAGYDYTREFGNNVYGFARAQAVYDDFDSFKEDYFLGVGAGYRVFNTNNIQWSVQAGPGVRATVDDNGDYDENAAYTLASYYYNRVNESVWLTNDTTLVGSDGQEYVTNDLAVNVAMSNALALRTSLLTEFNSDPLEGFEEYDNSLGVSVVYSFN